MLADGRGRAVDGSSVEDTNDFAGPLVHDRAGRTFLGRGSRDGPALEDPTVTEPSDGRRSPPGVIDGLHHQRPKGTTEGRADLPPIVV